MRPPRPTDPTAGSGIFHAVDHAHWMHRGKCTHEGANPEDWFPERGAGNAKYRPLEATVAEQLCSGCPVTKECLAHALSEERRTSLPVLGVWGGTTERQRKAHRLKQKDKNV